jgi:hypothetical protein
MMCRPNFHTLNAGKTLNQEKLYIIYKWFWQGPQKINLQFGKNSDSRTQQDRQCTYNIT